MTFANVLLGVAIGLPMMIAVGPISVLLLDQGLERGIRVAAPAALGVACADLTLSTLASATGTTVSSALAPLATWLTLAAVAVLVWIALDLGGSAGAELRAASAAQVRPDPRLVGAVMSAPQARAAGSVMSAPQAPAVGSTGSEQLVSSDPRQPGVSTFAHLGGIRLAGAFYGLTLVNPLTLVLFASVVVAGGAGVGTAGWAVGMALASLVAHGAFVVAGGVLGTTLGPVASARLRLGAALFMGALAVHFLVGL